MHSIDPVTFQGAGVAWATAITVVLGVVLAGLIRLWPQIRELRDLANQHSNSITANRSAIVRLSNASGHPEAVQPIDGEPVVVAPPSDRIRGHD